MSLTFLDILGKVVPHFDLEEYKYNYFTGDYRYNHTVNNGVIKGEYELLRIVEDGLAVNEWHLEQQYIVFCYDNKYYRIEYSEGSHGWLYKFDEDTFKEVFPKEKMVKYYE